MLALPNDLFLSVVVIAAVVVFGALISVGNERQRKAIDKLHHSLQTVGGPGPAP